MNALEKKYRVKVKKIEQLSSDIVSVYLDIDDDFNFQAGQYLNLLAEDGKPRFFSIANAPGVGTYDVELHIREVDKPFGKLLRAAVTDSHTLYAQGPFGDFIFRTTSTRPVLFIAGGTGFAPIKALMEIYIQQGETRSVFIYWGGRRSCSLYMEALVHSWVKNYNVDYVPVLSDAEPGLDWQGKQGYVHQAVLQDFSEITQFDVYVNGPPAMVLAAREALFKRGLDDQQFFSDLDSH